MIWVSEVFNATYPKISVYKQVWWPSSVLYWLDMARQSDSGSAELAIG